MKISKLTLGIGLALSFSGQAFAQQSNDQTTAQAVEKIEVTGSHIKGVDMEGAQPLTIISAEDIRKSGATTVFELMSTITQTRGGEGSFSTSESGATSTSTPAGQAAASLRGLGPSATLTLINGRRIAASSFASGTQNFVDINSIPLAAIERIEVLATGASATYGADAVAGVINYILKKDYKGAELNAVYGNSTASSDEGSLNLNFIWGDEVAGGDLMLFADYYDRKDFKATDRSYTRDPVLESSYSYLSKTPNIYYYSARDGNEIANPNCATPLVTTEFGEEICAYYGNEDDWLETPLESVSAGFTYNKEFGDLNWKTDFFYTRTKSTSYSTPAPINQVDDSEGPFADETALDIFSDDIRNDLLDRIYIDPFDTVAGRTLYGFQFDARFATPRTVEIETDSFRLVSGLTGTVGEWDWESAVTLSKSESEQVAVAGIYNRYKYHAAIAGELCSDGSIADYDADADSLSCGSGSLLGMYNPFLMGDATNDAILGTAQEMPTRDGESTVYGWDLRFSGDLMEFNDDVIRSAFGLEVRKEEITDVPSLNARARFENDYLVDVFGFGSSLSEAKRTQWGAFGEFHVPLTEQLEMQLAGRYDHYDDFGGDFNPKVAFTFRPTDDLVLRASWATSFRAPSLTQAGVKLRTTRASFDCSANQAVADLYCEGFGDLRGNNVLELGNPELEAEESESVSIGFGYSPTRNTNITVDYWRFDHEKLVDTDMTGVLDRAITDASLRHCGLVPEGEIGISYDPQMCEVTDSQGLTIEEQGANLTEILDAWVDYADPRFAELELYRDHVLLLENTGTQTVSGVDFTFDHRFEFEAGSLSFSLDATHYISYERNKPGSDEIEELAGTWRYPENIATARLFWDQENWYAGLTAYYTASYEDDIERLRGRELDELDALGELDENGLRDVSSWTTVRATFGYEFEKANVSLSIDNIFDREPPRAYGSARGFDSINHDAYGTTYKVSLTYFF
ncbi:TonB-dependent receptor domain-containing protein [Bowmanella dokdonensis]|uniref:TonB-dependent receptor n=1 Tax=Bowmanella dokdonensis TaxID=751969 RepID=A0A939INR5_9ALTE|nr:TonB-dependent receptor [Bowmanella dokdonensis]MBN7825120.1 TonB-dependent receptor [Bowmanella dokdonensis]